MRRELKGPHTVLGGAFLAIGVSLAMTTGASAQQSSTNGGLPAELYDPSGATVEGETSDAGAADVAAADRALPEITQSKLDKAERILGIALPKERLGQMVGALRADIEAQMREEAARRGQELTPEIADRLVAAMEEELNLLYAAMLPQLPAVYAGVFTEAELDTLLTLYSSAEGRAVLEKLTVLSAGLSEVMGPYIAVYRNRLRQRVRQELEAVEAEQEPASPRITPRLGSD